MPAIEFPARLADDVVAVRTLEERDAAAFAKSFRDDPELGRLLGLSDDPDEAWARDAARRSAETAREGQLIELAITDATTRAYRGGIVLANFAWKHCRCDLGYHVASDARGRGLATAAVSLVLGWLFGELDLLRVEVATTTENLASQALARRLGFTQEAVQRRRDMERGRRVDVVRFGLLREEWVDRGS